MTTTGQARTQGRIEGALTRLFMKSATVLETRVRENVLGTPVEQFTRAMFTRLITAIARTPRERDLTVGQVAILHQHTSPNNGLQSDEALQPAPPPSRACR